MTELLLESPPEARPKKRGEAALPPVPQSIPSASTAFVGNRDLRLDWLRGFCILGMLLLHGLATPFNRATSLLGFVSVAEGFFFISGAIVGIVYRRRLARDGLRPAAGKLWRRAAQLYLANLVLVVLFAFLERYKLVPMRKFAWRWGADWSWPRVFAMDQPYFLQILPRYSLFLLFTPLCLWLLNRKMTLIVAGASVTLYAAHLFNHQSLFLPFFESGRVGFHAAAWQLLYFGGMMIGWHSGWLGGRKHLVFHPAVLGVAMAASVGFIILSVLTELQLLEIPKATQLFGRPHLGPLRLVNVAVLFLSVFWLCGRFWPLIERATGALFIPAGQNGLYIYLAHIPIIVFAEWLVYEQLAWPKSALWYILPNVCFVGLMMFMVQRKVLFGVIPR